MMIRYIEVRQPIGTFYLAQLPASFLVQHARVAPRTYDHADAEPTGIQRRLSSARVREIAKYTGDPDATFPTSVILNIDSRTNDIQIGETEISIDEESFECEVIDGQHRIFGLQESNRTQEFSLPVVLMFDLTEEEKAYIFSTINGNQRPIDRSLIYDLFGLSRHRSPYRTGHELARALNSDPDSPLQNRLKMLGRTVTGEESLSQGAFVSAFVPLISNAPDEDLVTLKNGEQLREIEGLPLRKYFVANKDDVLYRVLLNYFQAFASVFQAEWNDHREYMLSRSTGFGGMILALGRLAQLGLFNQDLSREYFHRVAHALQELLRKESLALTSDEFPSNIQQQRRFQRLIEQAAGTVHSET